MMPNVRRLHGPLQIQAFEQSWRALIQRHESLRTTFQVWKDQPIQIIHPPRPFPLSLVDLSILLEDEQEAQIQKLAQEEAERPCDLSQGPLLRVALVRLEPQEHILFITMHHIISDALSTQVLVQEFSTFYSSLTSNLAPTLSPLPVQYADYALWQHKWLRDAVLEEQLTYWRRQLANVPTLDLPVDYPYPPRQTFNGAYQAIALRPALREELVSLSQREGVTLFMTLLAAFQVLLMRYTGQTDFGVGTPIANRSRVELEGLIGFFVNTLVMRADLADNPPFTQLVSRVREAALGAYAHQDIPFEFLVEELQPQRDLSHPPLFQVMFGVQQAVDDTRKLDKLTVSDLDITRRTAKFALSLIINETPDAMYAGVEYNTDLFAGETMQRLLQQWQTLLEAIVEAPQTRVGAFPLLSAEERKQVLCTWNATQQPWTRDASLGVLVQEQALRTPDALALVSEEGSLSYGALERLAQRMAHALRAHGIGAQTPVLLHSERSLLGAIGLLAIWNVGGVLVPVDISVPQERLAWMAQETQAPLLLCSRAYQEPAQALGIPSLCLSDDWWQGAAGENDVVEGASDLHEGAYILYTSGSTGRPKGVLVSHAAIVNRLLWGAQALALGERDRLGQVASWGFDIALWELLAPWLVGGTTVLLSSAQVKDPARLRQGVRQEALTVLHLVPSLLHLFIEHAEGWQGGDLRAVQTGGEAVPADLVRAVLARGGVLLHQYYGPTESAISVTCWEGSEPKDGERVSLGRGIANTRLYVLDAWGEPVGIGVPGEIYIGGRGLAWGYVGRAQQTAERFVPDPFSQEPGARLYRTGDLGRYQANGELVFVGRADSQVKIRGYRIEPGEIEQVLREEPGVREAVVLARREGEEDELRLVAYVVGDEGEGERLQEQGLREALGRKVPAYMVPGRMYVLDGLPLTTNGKLDRKALLAYKERSGEEAVDEQEEERRTPVEELLCGIWQEVLGGERVGVEDDFFASGGHSLLATRLVARMRVLFGIELQVTDIFDAPTVAEQAQLIEEALRGSDAPPMPALTAQLREGDIPLSFAQQRLWFLEQLDPENTAYLITGAYQLAGSLNSTIFDASVSTLLQRHEALRTVILSHDGKPRQHIQWSDESFHVPIIDLSGLAVSEREVVARQLATAEAHQPCNLERGPLLRITLLKLAEQRHILLLTAHHIISDAWSMQILLREISVLYRSGVTKEQENPLPVLPVQYADYARWQRAWLQEDVLEGQLSYWRQQLEQVPTLDLPTDRVRPMAQSYRGARERVQMPLEVYEGLKVLSQREGVTLFMTLLAGFQVVLQRYTGQSDVSVGTPIANRSRAELEGLIGLFLNTLVLRTDLSGNPSFVELLRRVREVALGAYAHQDVPFEQLVEELQPQRDLSRSPLFQVMFGVVQLAEDAEQLPNLAIRKFDTERATTQFDLTLTVVVQRQHVWCDVEYSTDLFEAATIQRLLAHWQMVLQSIVQQPQSRLSALPMLPEAEAELLLRTWNQTRRDLPASAFIHTLIQRQAHLVPQAIAVRTQQEAWSYERLNAQANRLAWHLRARGVGSEARVGLLVPRSASLLVAMLGVLKAGGAYVPLDPSYPSERIRLVAQDAGLSLILSTSDLQAIWSGQGEALAAPLQSISALLAEAAPPEAEQDQDVFASPEQAAYMIYTSGSTGRPKGVVISHANVVNFFHAMDEVVEVSSESVWLAVTSSSFDISVLELLWTLSRGIEVRLASSSTDAQEMVAQVGTGEITHLQGTPSLARLLLEQPRGAQGLAQVQHLLLGGEALPETLVEQVQAVSAARIYNMYGPTETTIWSSCEALSPGGAITLGRPLANTRLYVLDAAGGVVPLGGVGELCIGGLGVGRGYWQRGAQTAECFVPDAYSGEPGARLYRTGDLARYRSDGHLEYLGRRDQQVKLRGHRIELEEISRESERYAGVGQAVAVVRQVAGAEARLALYVVARGEGDVRREALREWLRQRLPEPMVPGQIEILQALPLTPNGKIDRKRLPEPQWEGEHGEVEEARTPLEEMLAGIWMELLGRKRVGKRENFFELGGHSLLATRLLARVQAVLGVEVALRTVFEGPTIEQVASTLERLQRSGQGAGSLPALEPMERPERLPLSFAQQRLWFLHQLDAENTAYLLPSARRLRGNIDIRVLEQSIQALVERHESLRTTFHFHESQPVQVIHSFQPVHLPVIDLSSLDEATREQEARTLAEQEALCPCDLGKGPLLRVSVLRLQREDHILLVTMHHIISDAWSMEVLVQELTGLYRALRDRQSVALPALAIQYADYALWQRQWLQGTALEEQLAYWRTQLADVPHLEFLTDYPRPPRMSFNGAVQSARLPLPLQEALVALGQREGVTLFMLLLASWQILLMRYTGQTDFGIGTAIANRTRTELERLIGFFVNTLVLRTDLSDDPTFTELLGRVRNVTLGAYAHRDIPFEQLVEELQPQRDLSRSPLFQVAFTFQQIGEMVEQLDGVAVSGFAVEHTTTKFDLTLNVVVESTSFALGVEYNTDLFAEETMQRLLHSGRRYWKPSSKLHRRGWARSPCSQRKSASRCSAPGTQPSSHGREMPAWAARAGAGAAHS
ncbi:hypothetical protein KSB_86010 [Ktedonobacter robiniae]|uniref:Carrier domain-containing protein n=2 Tax=Ktedonobacter robiniae TaxID=2778365 RepID=A0ABQ3V4M2_9CHLR|nr:hypothetical protein KSB_86010 [Ktedonobacter robiniae]